MKNLVVTFLAIGLCLAAGTALADDLEARGRALLNELGCKACHHFEGQGGPIGPPLDHVGKRLSQDRIRQQLLAPKKLNPNSGMPSYDHLAEQDIDTLVEFLDSRK